MKIIPLTKGKVALVDDEDFDLLSRWKWHAQNSKTCWYARRSIWIPPKKFCVSMHAQLMSPPVGVEIDHRDGDGLNNQKFNLRFASQLQNCRNMRLSVANTSGYKGVSFHRKTRKWCAMIKRPGQRYIGLFFTRELAALAYDQAAIESFGEFAMTNARLGLL